jgi:hypothetical protein
MRRWAAPVDVAPAEGKYPEGGRILVEIVDAAQAVARARTNHVRSAYDHEAALVKLQRATSQPI